MKIAFHILIIFLAAFNLLLSYFVMFPLRQPTTLAMWAVKVFVCALAPVLFLVGVFTALLGLFANSLPAGVIGILSALIYFVYIIQTSRPPKAENSFDNAFGVNWEKQIPEERKNSFLKNRYVLLLPKSPEPVFQQDISFCTIPETGRELLCDIWQPPKNIARSGLAFIYLHGSAWVVLDKDFGTRKFFKHLAAQGHIIMDVAYRLFPEVGFMGMVHDAKYAIAWMKKNAAVYGIDPDRIVIGGGSAGAHIALLAAYTADNNELTPADLETEDLSVRGVISLYGQADLEATFYHTCQHLVTHSALSQKKKGDVTGIPAWMQKRMGADFHRLGFDKNVEPGMLIPILGGNPKEKPESYALFSPITYANKDCPTTLFIHGKHDILAPIHAIRRLYAHLTEANVPTVLHEIPKTDHAFDLILPKISSPAHNAYYDVDRFLALMTNKEKRKEVKKENLEAALV